MDDEFCYGFYDYVFHRRSLVANTSTDGIVEYSSAGPLGLSTLSMYNYLTSSFKPGSVTVYSGRGCSHDIEL